MSLGRSYEPAGLQPLLPSLPREICNNFIQLLFITFIKLGVKPFMLFIPLHGFISCDGVMGFSLGLKEGAMKSWFALRRG